MIFLAFIGFLSFFVLGALFVFVGLSVLWWSAANGSKDYSWILPAGIGATLIYLACAFAPFTISIGGAA